MIGPERRWRWRAPRVARGLFDPRGFTVGRVAPAAARDFVVRHHYSGTYPASRLELALRAPDGRVVGVAVFSVPPSELVVPKWTGLAAREGVELGRLVLLDEVGFNAETWFLSRAFAALRAELVDVRAVLSFSDPATWGGASGPDRFDPPGHVGTIYAALGGRYVGRAGAKTLLLGARTGRPVSPRALSKLRTLDRGHAYARRVLESEFGVGPPERLDYLRWVREQAATIRHPGNHAFVWPLGRGGRRGAARDARAIAGGFPAALPYPTAPDHLELRWPYREVAE